MAHPPQRRSGLTAREQIISSPFSAMEKHVVATRLRSQAEDEDEKASSRGVCTRK
jgi:hypothetical protein